MRTEDLNTLVAMGKALWADPARSERIAAETLTAVSLLDLTEERAIERAAAVLLERAEREGAAAQASSNADAMNQPFFRLFPEERFLLAALHLGRWSYARLARVMSAEEKRVEELAWAARVRLSGRNPIGSAARGTSCPEYDARLPWTQRFLDEEIRTSRERIFLQNHLMACDDCRKALASSREVYYAVEARLPRPGEGAEQQIFALVEARTRLKELRSPARRDFKSSLEIFIQRPDVLVAVLALIALTVAMVAHQFR
jgi:hypothetical protein